MQIRWRVGVVSWIAVPTSHTAFTPAGSLVSTVWESAMEQKSTLASKVARTSRRAVFFMMWLAL
jgi:hypothetical protein